MPFYLPAYFVREITGLKTGFFTNGNHNKDTVYHKIQKKPFFREEYEPGSRQGRRKSFRKAHGMGALILRTRAAGKFKGAEQYGAVRCTY